MKFDNYNMIIDSSIEAIKEIPSRSMEIKNLKISFFESLIEVLGNDPIRGSLRFLQNYFKHSNFDEDIIAIDIVFRFLSLP